MIDSMRFCEDASSLSSSDGAQNINLDNDDIPPIVNMICVHDGVQLKKAGAEHISDINTFGTLSIVDIKPPRKLFLEWTPNESEVLASENQDWAVVDTISIRNRTVSESKVFNTNLTDSTESSVGKSSMLRVQFEDLASVRIVSRGQTLCFLRKSDGVVHSEYFFQHRNADLFLESMCKCRLIDYIPGFLKNSSEYAILNHSQKPVKTFENLNLDEIKSHNDGWISNKIAGYLVTTIPNFVTPPSHKNSPNKMIHGSRTKSPVDNYHVVGSNSNNSTSKSNSGSQSRTSSLDKSPLSSEPENFKEIDEKLIHNLPERPEVQRGPPLDVNQWMEFQTRDGHISDPGKIKEIIFRGGIVPCLRSEVWKYLLNYYQWSDTEVERIERRKEKTKEYYTMKAQWLSMSTRQENNFSGYRERKCQIDKDVKRTDRSLEFFAGESNPNLEVLQGILMTYVMYNFDLGYVQGMSDLLAPVLAIQSNEVDAFWCFVGFMEMVFGNFDVDQAGMKNQFNQVRRLLEYVNPRLYHHIVNHDSDNMYFCFRWLLVWYKREFNNDDVLKLWECLWSRLPCPNFHILISVAILDQETDIIIQNKYEFTAILKHINELSGHIDVTKTIDIAEAIYLQLKAAENLPNDIRAIIGEPLLETLDGSAIELQEDSTDGFDEIVPEPTPAEKKRQQQLLEEACEQSMYRNYF